MRMRTGIGNLGSQRQGNPYGGSRRTGLYLKLSAKLRHSFAHAEDPHTQTSSRAVPALNGFLAHSAASITDLEVDASGIAAQLDLGRWCARVPLNVCQAFLLTKSSAYSFTAETRPSSSSSGGCNR